MSDELKPGELLHMTGTCPTGLCNIVKQRTKLATY